MSATDCPDWQNVVTLQSGGGVSDAPDWQEVITGPGGTPPAASAGPSITDYPPDQGLIGWSLAPNQTTAGQYQPTSGLVYLFLVKAVEAGTVNHIVLGLGQVGTGITANQNYVGIYSPVLSGGSVVSYSLQVSSAAGVMDTHFTPLGLQRIPLSTGLAVTAGEIVYVGYVQNLGGTDPAWYYQNGSAVLFPAGGLPYLYFQITAAGGHTTLPSSVTVASCTTESNVWWVGLAP